MLELFSGAHAPYAFAAAGRNWGPVVLFEPDAELLASASQRLGKLSGVAYHNLTGLDIDDLAAAVGVEYVASSTFGGGLGRAGGSCGRDDKGIAPAGGYPGTRAPGH